jgi:hypothetical protein
LIIKLSSKVFNLINLEVTSVCASLFGYAWLLVACVGFEKFTKFVKKFEKVLNGFEFKRFELKEFEKEREKKKKRPHLSFSPQRPTGPSSFFWGSPPAASLFLFPCVADRAVPPVGASSSSCPLPFLCSAGADRDTTLPRTSSASPSIRGLQSRAIIPTPVSPPNPFCFPFPFVLFAAALPTINGKCAGRHPLPRFPFSPLCLYKSRASSLTRPFRTCSHSAPPILVHAPSPFGDLPPGHRRLLEARRR